MEEIPAGDSEGNAPPLTPEETHDADRFGVLFAAVMTFGCRLRAHRWLHLARAEGADTVAMERAVARVDDVDGAVAALAMAAAATPQVFPLYPEAEAFLGPLARLMNDVAIAPGLPTTGAENPQRPTRAERLEIVDRAQALSDAIEPLRRAAVKREAPAAPTDPRPEQWEYLSRVARTVDQRSEREGWTFGSRALGVFLSVAWVVQWGPGATDDELDAAALKVLHMRGEPTGERMVNAALRALGHKTDAVKGAKRMEGSRRLKGEKLSHALSTWPDATRRKILDALVSNDWGMGAAAKQLGTTAPTLRALILADASLSAALDAAPAAPPARGASKRAKKA